MTDKSDHLSESVGRAAHDLNNVCASMVGFTTLAKDLADPGSVLAQYLAEIQIAADNAIVIAQRLHELSNALREVSRR